MHAAECAREFVGDDDFVMYLGDNILNSGVTDLVESFQQGDYEARIALQRVGNSRAFGIADSIIRATSPNSSRNQTTPDRPGAHRDVRFLAGGLRRHRRSEAF